MQVQSKSVIRKQDIENKILKLEKQKLKAIKEQNYAYAALMRDQERELMYKLRKL